MAVNDVSLADLAVFLAERHPLKCDCCGRQTMAYWEPPNKVVIHAKHHGKTHRLTVIVAVAANTLQKA